MARRPLPLRTRVSLSFGLLALLGGLALSVTTYLFTRTSLIDQREASARTAALTHARQMYDAFGDPQTIDDVLGELDLEQGGYAVVIPPGAASQNAEGRVFSSGTGYSLSDFPDGLVNAARQGQSAEQQFTNDDGAPHLGIAIRVEGYDAAYIEAFPMTSIDRTLLALSTALLVGSIATTAIALFLGWSASRRLLQPIARVAGAAEDIASGSLDARLDAEDDPDLQRVVSSFNKMAHNVQDRIEREQRFTSDVSHELRSPITALAAAVEVLAARRDELDERSGQALDVVVGQVRRFDGMVIDLLELSRIDAAVPDINRESVQILDLTERIAARYGYTDLPIELDRKSRTTALVDRIRYERILSNLLDNASTHAGGPTRVSIESGSVPRSINVAVEDAGPGVAASERERIFERFARGSAARHRIGTGLGLALVAEHASALGGAAWVEDLPTGGSRFVVGLPCDETVRIEISADANTPVAT